MGYFNRDRAPNSGRRLAGTDDRFMVWHDACFPVYRPLTHEKFGHDSRESFAASIFGGIDHLAELAVSDRWYADQIERRLTDGTRWTPDGYAWAPWEMGAPCEHCGRGA